MRSFTLSCFLLLLLGRLSLLALSLFFSTRKPAFFSVKSILSCPCSRSDPFLFHQDAALAHFNSTPPHDLMLWTDGFVPFPFGKGGSGVLANCSLCGTEDTFSFSAGPACLSFFAEACAILQVQCFLTCVSRHVSVSLPISRCVATA